MLPIPKLDARCDAEARGKRSLSAIERRATSTWMHVIGVVRNSHAQSRMRTLLWVPIVIAISACIADIEDEAQRDENATTEQPGDMPSNDESNNPRDPCAMGLAFDETGDLLSVPSECIAAPEVDNGDPPPDAEGVSEHSIMPH